MIIKNSLPEQTKESILEKAKGNIDKKSQFDDITVYKPTIFQKLFKIPDELKGIQYNTVVTQDFEFYFWQNFDDDINQQKEIQDQSILDSQNSNNQNNEKIKKSKTKITKLKHRSSLKNNEDQGLFKTLNKLNPLSKLKIFKEEKTQSVKNIQYFNSNKQGILCAVFPQYKIIKQLEQCQDKITVIEFIEGQQNQNDSTEQYQVLIGTQNGHLYYSKIILNKQKSKSSDSFCNFQKTKIYTFLDEQKKPQQINGIIINENHQNNFLFFSLDKYLYYLHSKTDMSDLIPNFENNWQNNSKYITESNYSFNQIFGQQGLNNFFNLLFYTKDKIKIINMNQETQDIRIDESQIYDNENFTQIDLTEKINFYPYFYHYVLINSKGFKVISTLSKEVVYHSDWDSVNKQVGYIGKNNMNNNLVLVQDNSLIELFIDKEKENSWVQLVNQELEQLAYLSVENSSKDKDKVGLLLANKLFNKQEYSNGIQLFFEHKENFETIVSKILQLEDYNQIKYLIKYLILKLNSFKQQEENKDKVIIILIILIEKLSYQYVHFKKILQIQSINLTSIKEKTNIQQVIEYYKKELEQIIKENQKFLKAKLVKEFFLQHNNTDFLEFLCILNKDYMTLINFYYFEKDFQKCIINIHLQFDKLIKNNDLTQLKKEEKLRRLGEYIDKYSQEIFDKESLKLIEFIRLVCNKKYIEDLPLKFYEQCFSFTQQIYQKNQMKPVLDILFEFLKMIKKYKNKKNADKKQNLEIILSNILIFNFNEYEMYDYMNNFILLFDGGKKLKVSKNFRQISSYLLMKIQNKSQAVKVLINTYGILEMYQKAVLLALDQKEQEFEQLAINWASRASAKAIQKKLWMFIAKNQSKNSQNKNGLIKIIKHKKCPLKLGDVIELFPENLKNDEFSDLIEQKLEDHDYQHKTFEQKLDLCKKTVDYLEQKIKQIQNQYVIVKHEERCSYCDQNIFNDFFFYFNCDHFFHKSCMNRFLEECGFQEKLTNIQKNERDLDQFLRKFNIILSSILKRQSIRI